MNRKMRILTVSALIACAGAALSTPQDDLAAVGHRVFSKSCANCHFVPDPTIERDKVWTELIKTTA